MKFLKLLITFIVLSKFLSAQFCPSLDSSFAQYGHASLPLLTKVKQIIFLQSDASISLCQQADRYLIKHDVNGKIDSSFGVYGKLKVNLNNQTIEINNLYQKDNYILIFGHLMDSLNQIVPCLLKTDTNINLIQNFGTNGVILLNSLTNYNDPIGINLDSNDQIYATSINLQTMSLIKIKSNGTIDSSFGFNGLYSDTFSFFINSAQFDIKVDQTNNVVILKPYKYNNYKYKIQITKLLPNGTIDSGFGNNGIALTGFDVVQGYFLYHDCKLLVNQNNDYEIASCNRYNSFDRATLTKIKNNGLIDSTFGLNGISIIAYHPINMAIGETFVDFKKTGTNEFILSGIVNNSGLAASIYFAKCNSNGNIDSTFCINGFSLHDVDTFPSNIITTMTLHKSKLYLGVEYGICDTNVCISKGAGIMRWQMNPMTPNAIIERQIESNDVLYPNPAESRVYFKNLLDIENVLIVTASGQLIKQCVVENSSFNVADLVPSTYFAIVKEKEKSYTFRFEKK